MTTIFIIRIHGKEHKWDNENGQGEFLSEWNENPEIEFKSEAEAKDYIKESILCEDLEITDANGYDAMVWCKVDKTNKTIIDHELIIEQHIITTVGLDKHE